MTNPEIVSNRLKDIVFLAERTAPVDGDWEGYAREVLKIIVSQARQAQHALAVTHPEGAPPG